MQAVRVTTTKLYALWLLILGLVVIVGSACQTARAAPVPGLRIERVTDRYVVFTITAPTVTDGKGAIDGFRTKLRQGADSSIHVLPVVARDSFAYVPAPFGQTASGYVYAASRRRVLLSTYDSLPWSATEADSPPPPPKIGLPIVVGMDTFSSAWLTVVTRTGMDRCPTMTRYSTVLQRTMMYPTDSSTADCVSAVNEFNALSQ